MDDLIKARSSSRPRRQHLLVKAFSEDASPAQNGVAVKAARQYNDANGLVRDRKIRQPPLITTMNSRRSGAASRTTASFARGPHFEHRAAEIITYAFNNKTTRNQLDARRVWRMSLIPCVKTMPARASLRQN